MGPNGSILRNERNFGIPVDAFAFAFVLPDEEGLYPMSEEYDALATAGEGEMLFCWRICVAEDEEGLASRIWAVGLGEGSREKDERPKVEPPLDVEDEAFRGTGAAMTGMKDTVAVVDGENEIAWPSLLILENH